MSLRRLDVIERTVVLLVTVASTILLVPGLREDLSLSILLVLAANLAVAVFVVLRARPEQISVRPSDWAVSIVGTVAPLFDVPATGPRVVSVWVAAPLALVGLTVSLLAKISLRRSFSIVPARGEIVSHGLYRLVRHPMYAGYVLTHLGILLYGFLWWNLACYLVAWIGFWLRIRREEALLTHEPTYLRYCDQVRYRLLPGLL